MAGMCDVTASAAPFFANGCHVIAGFAIAWQKAAIGRVLGRAQGWTQH
jgi:hypothetical protein